MAWLPGSPLQGVVPLFTLESFRKGWPDASGGLGDILMRSSGALCLNPSPGGHLPGCISFSGCEFGAPGKHQHTDWGAVNCLCRQDPTKIFVPTQPRGGSDHPLSLFSLCEGSGKPAVFLLITAVPHYPVYAPLQKGFVPTAQ